MIKILVNFRNGTEWQNFKIQVADNCTVGHLIVKLRKFIKIKPEEACFCFFCYSGFFGKKEKIFHNNKLLIEIQSELCMEVLEVKLLLENTFGALSKMFVKARIEHRQSVFCAIITWSYYGIYHYDELSVHNTMVEATEHLLKIRCNGCLSLENSEKK